MSVAPFTAYPWRYELPPDGNLSAKDIEDKAEADGFEFERPNHPSIYPNELEPDGMYVYYYVRDRSVSNSFPPVQPPGKFSLFRQSLFELFARGSTRTMLPSQYKFLMAYAPNNRALIRQFSAAYNANYMLHDREDVRSVVGGYVTGNPGKIQQLVSRHSQIDGIDTLLDLARQLPDLHVFYNQLFYPAPRRLSVPLPVGTVLLEGRSNGSALTRALVGPIRKEPFSTSWHPNAALHFLRPNKNDPSQQIEAAKYVDAQRSDNVLFVHKVVSPGILAVDVQGPNAPQRRTGAVPWREGLFFGLYDECEIIVQPMVKIHAVETAAHLMHYDMIWNGSPENRTRWVLVQTTFTHLYLGDECPCGHGRDAYAAYAAQRARYDDLAAKKKQADEEIIAYYRSRMVRT